MEGKLVDVGVKIGPNLSIAKGDWDDRLLVFCAVFNSSLFFTIVFCL